MSPMTFYTTESPEKYTDEAKLILGIAKRIFSYIPGEWEFAITGESRVTITDKPTKMQLHFGTDPSSPSHWNLSTRPQMGLKRSNVPHSAWEADPIGSAVPYFRYTTLPPSFHALKSLSITELAETFNSHMGDFKNSFASESNFLRQVWDRNQDIDKERELIREAGDGKDVGDGNLHGDSWSAVVDNGEVNLTLQGVPVRFAATMLKVWGQLQDFRIDPDWC